MTELSEQQRQAIREHPDSPVLLVDPSTQSQYVLIPAQAYSRLKALLDDDQFEIEEAYPLMDEVAAKAGWDDPVMNEYERLDPRKTP